MRECEAEFGGDVDGKPYEIFRRWYARFDAAGREQLALEHARNLVAVEGVPWAVALCYAVSTRWRRSSSRSTETHTTRAPFRARDYRSVPLSGGGCRRVTFTFFFQFFTRFLLWNLLLVSLRARAFRLLFVRSSFTLNSIAIFTLRAKAVGPGHDNMMLTFPHPPASLYFTFFRAATSAHSLSRPCSEKCIPPRATSRAPAQPRGRTGVRCASTSTRARRRQPHKRHRNSSRMRHSPAAWRALKKKK